MKNHKILANELHYKLDSLVHMKQVHSNIVHVVHAGRQGALTNIATNVIDCFTNIYKCDTQNILVTIGASIGSCCYEVGREIDEEAKALGFGYAMIKRGDSYYLDVTSILKKQLTLCGILEKNIETSNECSCCSSDKYFSYRADGVTGRFAGVLKLN